MAAGPIAVWHRPDIERHAKPISGIEARAANLRQIPIRAEIARAPLVVRLEAASRQHNRARSEFERPPGLLHAHALHAVVVHDERERAAPVADLDAQSFRDRGPRVDESGTTAVGLNRQAAPEFELTVDKERLASPNRREADALLLHPHDRFPAAFDQELAQHGISAVFGDPAHVVEELLFGVSAEVGARHFGVGEIRHQSA